MGNSGPPKLWLLLVLTVTAIGLAACGDDDGTTTGADEAGTTAARDEAETTAQEGGEPILIKTHLTFVEDPTAKVGARGQVLPRSTVGGSAFCAGGSFSDRRGEPPLGSVVKTFRCPGGRLTITFSPSEPSERQSSDWEVVNGTGRFEGLGGGGRMWAVFKPNGTEGREIFVGSVTR
jgi:hypothetical protein